MRGKLVGCSMADDSYTLSALERMRAETAAAWAKMVRDRQLRIMEQLGPEVYFAVLASEDFRWDQS